MSNIVGAKILNNMLNDSAVIIIDCRFNLANPEEGRLQYNKGHIPRAVYFDLNLDMSSQVKEHGGRHPLPDMDHFEQKLREAGVTEESIVVAYDDQDGAMAARLWWLLKYVGHSKGHILDGGYRYWLDQGYPITTEIPSVKESQFVINIQKEMIMSMDDVKQQLEENSGNVIDSRDPRRYKGEIEPIDKKAGHIPGAINLFWKENLNQGRWLSIEALSNRFKELKEEEPITVYCGSGVTACANLFALSEAGYHHAKLYSGSFSDWISHKENPIANEQ